MTGIPRLGEPSELAIFRSDDRILKAELKTEFSPLAIGTSGSHEQIPIVFAGYGITAKDERVRLDYDDYAGIDVQGKAVLIIRREPQQDREDSPFAGTKTTDYATFRHKASNAFQHGAAMVLLVNDLAGLHGDEDRLLSPLLARQVDPDRSFPSPCFPGSSPTRSSQPPASRPGGAGEADRCRFEAAIAGAQRAASCPRR